MKSGALAGEAAFAAVLAARKRGDDALADMEAYPEARRCSKTCKSACVLSALC
jgi:hypothetical protein